ncbi:MAG TPA: fibronectin type III domain-containing protein [Ilumatobacter sp.]|nr:fibronectin type III domain-containing protein [Ilumatobacter sp.]
MAFVGSDGGDDSLWVSDGTDAGTRRVSPDGTDVRTPLTVLDDSIVMPGFTSPSGFEPWVYDGGTGATRTLDIEPGPVGSDPELMVELNGYVYFVARTTAAGSELWRTDGTTVERVTDIRPGPASSVSSEFLEVVDNQVWFAADDGVTGTEMWFVTDSPAPTAPGVVTGVAGNRSVAVSWAASAAAADAPVLGYTVTAAPGGATCSTVPPATTCTVTGLTNGTAYRFSVVATNRVGSSPAGLSAHITPGSPTGPGQGQGGADVLVPVAPARYWDTRAGQPTGDNQQSGTGRLAAGGTYEVPVAGRLNVPADATAIVANLTVIEANAAGFATIYPCTDERPNVSAANYSPGDVLANNVVVPLSANGSVCVFTRAGADFALDVNGYVDADAPDTAIGPARYLDTRGGQFVTFDHDHEGGGPVAARSITRVQVTGRGDVPAGATAAMVNLTAVSPAADGYLTAYPCTTDVPWASTVNYMAGQVVPNGGVAPLSATGELCIYSLAATDILLDVTGFVPAGVDSIVSLEPARLFDSRPGGELVDGTSAGPRLAAGSTVKVQVTGRHGIPASATAAFLNVALVFPDGPTFVTLFACDDPGTAVPPRTSNLNLVTGGVRANNALTALSSDGAVCVYNRSGADLVLDVTGYLR